MRFEFRATALGLLLAALAGCGSDTVTPPPPVATLTSRSPPAMRLAAAIMRCTGRTIARDAVNDHSASTVTVISNASTSTSPNRMLVANSSRDGTLTTSDQRRLASSPIAATPHSHSPSTGSVNVTRDGSATSNRRCSAGSSRSP